MPNILTINAGSSSIRFALFEIAARPIRVLEGKMERIGSAAASLCVGRTGETARQIKIAAPQGRGGVESLVDFLAAQSGFAAPDAVGHRVVHGMLHTAPERVTAELLGELRRMTPYDPEHLPREIELIEALQQRYPNVPHVACFDTAFHRSMPRVATLLPIPRRYLAQGVQRYGFHGLFYTFLMQGLALSQPMDAAQFQTMVNHESGLIGVSETSADVRDLLDREADDSRAREALALFCYQAKKWIGSFAAVLGGMDTLVFAGGIGENAAPLRRRICDGLRFLGIQIDEL